MHACVCSYAIVSLNIYRVILSNIYSGEEINDNHSVLKFIPTIKNVKPTYIKA